MVNRKRRRRKRRKSLRAIIIITTITIDTAAATHTLTMMVRARTNMIDVVRLGRVRGRLLVVIEMGGMIRGIRTMIVGIGRLRREVMGWTSGIEDRTDVGIRGIDMMIGGIMVEVHLTVDRTRERLDLPRLRISIPLDLPTSPPPSTSNRPSPFQFPRLPTPPRPTAPLV